ncbi:MAG: NFACT family protein [Chloroflexota bacterium]|nr:NFACT family protein [Chloroflexota bacterium]
MNFDALTLAAVRSEIEDRALGGRVQRVASPKPGALALEVYGQQARHHLLLDVDPDKPRVRFARNWPRAGTQAASPLLLLARKWVRGARLVEIAQPPAERILDLTFELQGPEMAEAVLTRLIVEFIGRQTNLLLVDEGGRIRDALRRVRGGGGGRRIEPGAQYERPAALDLPELVAVNPEDLRRSGAQGGTAWRVLLRGVRAVSPTLAREALARAGYAASVSAGEVSDWAAVLQGLGTILADAARGEWRPSLVPGESGWRAFAPYALTQFEEPSVAMASMSEALERFDAATATPEPVRDAREERLEQVIASAMERATRRVVALKVELESSAAADDLQAAGEALLAFGQGLPAGTREFEHEGRTIELDPRRSVVENAQRYFAQAKDRRTAARDTPKRIRQTELELGFLRQAADDLARADAPGVRQALEATLAEAGYGKSSARRRAAPASAGWTLGGYQVRAGRTAAENHRLTFHESAPDDLWLHARGVPGAHVLMRCPGGEVPDSVIEQAASIAAHLSAARDDATVEVDVTQRRRVRPIRGAGPGQVTYRGERTLRVTPKAPAEVGAERVG